MLESIVSIFDPCVFTVESKVSMVELIVSMVELIVSISEPCISMADSIEDRSELIVSIVELISLTLSSSMLILVFCTLTSLPIIIILLSNKFNALLAFS